MKYFIAITLIAAVASAAVRPTPVSAEVAEIQEIIAAIQSPSTDPATAAALEEMLLDVLGIKPEPVAIGPAIIPPSVIVDRPEPIAVGPVVPSPVIIGEIPNSQSPLVQIIVNVNKATPEAVPVSPVVRPEPIGEIPADPIQVVEVAPEPVQVVEVAPVPAEPVQIGVPVIPEAAVILPEELN